jgi:hypothetical protein
MRLLRTLGAVFLCLLVPTAARAATLQPIGNFEKPIYVTSDPGNPDRLFVVERPGRVKVVEGGTFATFADLRGIVGCPANGVCTGERGLLSIALAPDFDSSGRFFVDYVQNSSGEIHVAEMVAGGGSALSSTPREVLVIPHPGQSNHNGGQLQFGPDGYLYISTGDGGGKNDQTHNAQNLTTGLGKILRVSPTLGGGYTVPLGNPFAGVSGDYEPIWSYGLRNPYRFSFDRLSGALVIGDVGQEEREEIDYAPAPGLGGGANYGWNCREGKIAGPAETPDPECASLEPSDFVEPVFDYPHTNPGGAQGCAITGGYVVRDPGLGDLYGRYLYGDYCGGELRSLELALPAASGDRSEGIDVEKLVSFGQDSCGRLYTVSELGQVSRLVGALPTNCATVPPPGASKPLSHSFAGIKALRRAVKRGDKALLTAFVSPCAGRKGERIKLFRNRAHVATRRLDRVCSARFRPRIGRSLHFRVAIGADHTYVAATSRKLKIHLLKHHRRGGKGHRTS